MERVCIFRVIWNKLQPFGIFYTYPFGNLVVIWYIFPRFGILCKEKSGNPAGDVERLRVLAVTASS
jgi:hypothetical protein